MILYVVLTGATLLEDELLEDSEDRLLEDSEDSLVTDESLDELLARSDEDRLETTEDETAELTGGLLEDPPPPPQPVRTSIAEDSVIRVLNSVGFIL